MIIHMDKSIVKPPRADWMTQATLTVDETSTVLRLGRSATYEGVRNGEIPSIRIGRRVLVPVSALRALLDGTGAEGDAARD